MLENIATFQVSNYTIFRKSIGKGAFSTIYKGYDKKTMKVVAVKEISFEILKKYKDVIKRETKIMKKLNHENIIKLYDTILDDDSNNIYLVLEYIGRGDFSKFLKKRPLKEKYAKKYLIQLADGLKYLLENKIIHRDLKPQNILMSDAGIIKITDFGFARYFDNELLIQTVCGSPLYMAPEIMKNKKYDYKSDLWSVGIILYEMLYGRPPFKVKNIFELIDIIDKEVIDYPKNIIISMECKDLLERLLKKSPEDRISWDDFFIHPWLQNNELKENLLMEISNIETTNKMTDYLKNNNSSIFYKKMDELSKSRNSIISKSKLNISTNARGESDSIHFRDDSEERDSSYLYQKPPEDNQDFSLDFNFHLNDSNNSNNNDSNYSQYSFYKLNNSSEERDTSLLNLNHNYGSFVYINRPKINNIKKPNSLAGYLNNSIYFLKESYKYISNYNSI